ncbi:MAG TPA: hypothetical protein DDX84_10445 [Nitrospiraceae bacterium]|nr:hypothetical protein [Nitrospiraceae bacterium]
MTLKATPLKPTAPCLCPCHTSGVNALRGWLTAFRDIVGGKSVSYEKELARLEERAIAQLSEKASSLGANAIMCLRWYYSYIGGDRRSLLMLVATGTACRVSGMN